MIVFFHANTAAAGTTIVAGDVAALQGECGTFACHIYATAIDTSLRISAGDGAGFPFRAISEGKGAAVDCDDRAVARTCEGVAIEAEGD